MKSADAIAYVTALAMKGLWKQTLAIEGKLAVLIFFYLLPALLMPMDLTWGREIVSIGLMMAYITAGVMVLPLCWYVFARRRQRAGRFGAKKWEASLIGDHLEDEQKKLGIEGPDSTNGREERKVQMRKALGLTEAN